jgi:hypothetical protein
MIKDSEPIVELKFVECCASCNYYGNANGMCYYHRFWAVASGSCDDYKEYDGKPHCSFDILSYKVVNTCKNCVYCPPFSMPCKKAKLKASYDSICELHKRVENV